MEKLELERMLHSLGKRFTLDILQMINERGSCTASEVAKNLDIQVATAVKHLSGLYDADILVRNIRKGKTRSAYEYSLKNERIIIEIDIEELSGQQQVKGTDKLFNILVEITKKIGAFTGKRDAVLIKSWKERIDGHDATFTALDMALKNSLSEGYEYLAAESKDIDLATEIPAVMFDVLKIYEARYGKSSMRSLALTSRDAALRPVKDREIVTQIKGYLPKRFFD